MRLNDVKSSVLRHASQFLLNLQQDIIALTVIFSVHRLILQQDTIELTVIGSLHRLIPTAYWLRLRYTLSDKFETLCSKIRGVFCDLYWDF
jgi:hypothetical protein